MWGVKQLRNGDIHVVPLEDYKPHKKSRNCWCEPKIDKVIIHQALRPEEPFCFECYDDNVISDGERITCLECGAISPALPKTFSEEELEILLEMVDDGEAPRT